MVWVRTYDEEPLQGSTTWMTTTNESERASSPFIEFFARLMSLYTSTYVAAMHALLWPFRKLHLCAGRKEKRKMPFHFGLVSKEI